MSPASFPPAASFSGRGGRLACITCGYVAGRHPTEYTFTQAHTCMHTRTPATSLPSSCRGRHLCAVGLCPRVALLFSLLCSLISVRGFRRTKRRLVVVRAVIGNTSLLPLLLLVSCFTHVLCLVGVCVY